MLPVSEIISFWSGMIVGLGQFALAAYLLVLQKQGRTPRKLTRVFAIFFVLCGLYRFSISLDIWYVFPLGQLLNPATAAVSILALVMLNPFSQRIKRLPAPSLLVDQIAIKDRALKEKDEALEALRRQTQKMIELEEHDRRQKLLIGELNHRVKNTLAVVQSIARQSLRTSKDKESFAETFQERLMALSNTHTLLLDAGWDLTSFVELTDKLLTPYGKRFRSTGVDLYITPKAALSLGMALHELATNAIKHGAWHGADGLVEISARQDGDMIEIVWQESGGPVVVEPPSKSFGSRLLNEGIPRELGGFATKKWLPSGVVYSLRVRAGKDINVIEKTPSSSTTSGQ